MRRSSALVALVAAVATVVMAPGLARAQDDGAPTTTVPGPSAPLVAVPPGCAVPPSPAAVFVGTLVAHDVATARFRVEQVRAGSTSAWEAAGLIDVRFGDEVRFLDVDERYLVGAAVDPSTGALASKVAEHAPLFGGSSVIGLNESDVDCPRTDDGVRTLHVDGTTVDSGVLTPLRNSKGELLAAVLQPLAWAVLVLLALVAMKHLLFGTVRSVRDAPSVRTSHRPRRHRDVG